MRRRKPLKERFEEKFERRGSDECWFWTAKPKNGYGCIGSTEGGRWRFRYAHVVSWALANNEGLDSCDGLVIRHSCHIRLCVNPSHLSRGTQKQNIQDSIDQGTHISVLNRKLTDAQIRECRDLWSAGEWDQRSLARRFGVHQAGIWRIVHRLAYSRVK